MAELFWSSKDEGIDDVEAFFEYAGYKVRDMREPLTETKDHIQSVMNLQFLTEGEYRSGGWVPLSPDYEEWKIAHSPGSILVLTDEMRQVVLSDGSWAVLTDEAEFYPLSEKAGWHQEGVLDRGRGGELPARPILELNEADYAYIEQVFVEWLDELRTANIRRGLPDASIRPAIF